MHSGSAALGHSGSAALGRAGTVRWCFTGRTEGDLNADLIEARVLEARRAQIVPLPWTWLREVHGAEVVVVAEPGGGAGSMGDAVVTACSEAVLSVWVGDCAPVGLWSTEGVLGAVHAGWRGVEAGVIEAAVDAMRSLGATGIHALLGPCIHPECYEFGADDLERLAHRFGPAIRSTTSWGTAALDLVALMRAALAEHEVGLDASASVCTACSPEHWSHRARADVSRQALALWREP